MIKEKYHGPNHRAVVTALKNVGQTLSYQSKADEANEFYLKCIKICEEDLKKKHPPKKLTMTKELLSDITQELVINYEIMKDNANQNKYAIQY